MEIRTIDLATYPRRAHFAYFKDMANPYVGVTVNVELTDWFSETQAKQQPFFLSFLYRVLAAANAVPALRQRIRDGGIVEFSRCAASYTVALPDGTYCYCAVSGEPPLEEFLRTARRRQAEAMAHPSLREEGDPLSLFFVSTAPGLSYTSLVQPTPSPADSNPRITWGRYFRQEGKLLLPVSLLCHHALVDGSHMTRFYQELERQLRVEKPL